MRNETVYLLLQTILHQSDKTPSKVIVTREQSRMKRASCIVSQGANRDFKYPTEPCLFHRPGLFSCNKKNLDLFFFDCMCRFDALAFENRDL